MTRAAYDASFSKLVSFVASRDSRRSGNQRTLRWLVSLVGSIHFLNFVSAALGTVCERLGMVWKPRP